MDSQNNDQTALSEVPTKPSWVKTHTSEIAVFFSVVALLASLATFFVLYQKIDGIGSKNASIVSGAVETQKNPELSTAILEQILGSKPNILGDQNAKVTIVEYADFQCPFCKRFFQDVLPQLKTEYIDTGKAKFIYQTFPFLGPESYQAASAAMCAKEQERFWDFHDLLYQNQKAENSGAFSDAKLISFAKQIKLDQKQFNECLNIKKFDAEIQSEFNLGQQAGVGGTPTVFINSTAIVGAQPFANYKKIIDKYLLAP